MTQNFTPVSSGARLSDQVAEQLTTEIKQGRLMPGDTLFTYTDGITEAFDRDDQPFGTDRLLATLDPALSARAQCAHLVDAVHAFTNGAPQSDDITVLAVRYDAEAP